MAYATQSVVFFVGTMTFLLSACTILSIMDVKVAETKANLPQVAVRINNTMESKSMLTIHCKEKRRDLDAELVPYLGMFEFKFEPSRWGSTRYSCSFGGHFTDGQLKWFDIYVEVRDAVLCGTNCMWFVKQNGPCLHTQKDRCFSWNYS